MRHSRLVIMVSVVALGLLVLLLQERQRGASLSVTGELVAFEAARQELTLRTRGGDRHFAVREDTPVHEGATTIALADLRSASGCPAKVWYRDAQGRSIAREIRISCRVVMPRETSSAAQAPGR